MNEKDLYLRMSNIEDMYDYMGEDDETYDRWICLYPDDPDEDDIREMALNDEVYEEMLKDYARISKDAEDNRHDPLFRFEN